MFVVASLEHSRRILCLVYHMKLVYPAYQWIILSHTLSDVVAQKCSKNNFTFSYNNKKYTCTTDNLIFALEKAFLNSLLTLNQV